MIKAFIRSMLVLLGITGAAGIVQVVQSQNVLLNLGPAPELHEGIWLNTDTPLKFETLRGKVVLLEMWTFGCYNCVNTLPSVINWWDTYKDEGLVVIGNHMPEFDWEADLNNLRGALLDLEVTYPVLQDNDRLTWSAYNNRYWPTMYLIDKQGNIRYRYIGEGAYTVTEANIQTLLAEPYLEPETTPEPEAALWSLTANEQVNVRRTASLDGEIVGFIQPNEAYYVLGEQDGWLQIVFDGGDAFVWNELVTASR